MFKFSTKNNKFFCSNLLSFQEEGRAPQQWFHLVDMMSWCLKSYFNNGFGYQLFKMVPTWLAEMVQLLTTFWPELQIGTSETPYLLFRDFWQLYHIVILKFNYHFTFTEFHRKSITLMTAVNNSRRQYPFSQKSLSLVGDINSGLIITAIGLGVGEKIM